MRLVSVDEQFLLHLQFITLYHLLNSNLYLQQNRLFSIPSNSSSRLARYSFGIALQFGVVRWWNLWCCLVFFSSYAKILVSIVIVCLLHFLFALISLKFQWFFFPFRLTLAATCQDFGTDLAFVSHLFQFRRTLRIRVYVCVSVIFFSRCLSKHWLRWFRSQRSIVCRLGATCVSMFVCILSKQAFSYF